MKDLTLESLLNRLEAAREERRGNRSKNSSNNITKFTLSDVKCCELALCLTPISPPSSSGDRDSTTPGMLSFQFILKVATVRPSVLTPHHPKTRNQQLQILKLLVGILLSLNGKAQEGFMPSDSEIHKPLPIQTRATVATILILNKVAGAL